MRYGKMVCSLTLVKSLLPRREHGKRPRPNAIVQWRLHYRNFAVSGHMQAGPLCFDPNLPGAEHIQIFLVAQRAKQSADGEAHKAPTTRAMGYMQTQAACV